ncbi:uncharacterized protein LOC121396062 [Xenopus laevis]|uniref:Uncharacterized protein LOC121396062 n=1 Tax=Xenopus laevis TaxID=8355 RepID=A0A8J1LAN3_XENLA|nr:uncharacterized protein LOC121396062 [Xenopus laevis]
MCSLSLTRIQSLESLDEFQVYVISVNGDERELLQPQCRKHLLQGRRVAEGQDVRGQDQRQMNPSGTERTPEHDYADIRFSSLRMRAKTGAIQEDNPLSQICMLFSTGTDGQTPGYILYALRLETVTSGLCVEIPCRFTIPASRTLSTTVTGIWRRTDTSNIVAASTDASKVSVRTKSRFSLTGKVHEGDCSFSISNVQQGDQGKYEFRFEDGDHKYSYQWNRLNLIVTNLSEPTISPVGKLIAGKQITLTCTSHPTSQECKGNITWEGTVNIENSSNYEREDEDGKVSSVSNITFTPSQRDHKSSLTCTVTYSGVSTNSSISLNVESLPHEKIMNHLNVLIIRGISIIVLSGIIAVTAVLVMRCRKNSSASRVATRPANITSSFLVLEVERNQREVLDKQRGQIVTELGRKATPAHQETTENIAESIRHKLVQAEDKQGYNGPYENKSVAMIEGDTNLIRCEVNSNPVTNVSWKRRDDIFSATSGQGLTLALSPEYSWIHHCYC